MIEVTHGIKPFIFSLSQFFQNAPGWGLRQFTLKDTGRFNPTLRAVAYRLGMKWAMRYVTDDVDMYVFVVLDQANNGVASVSYKKHGEASVQWKFTLLYAPKLETHTTEIRTDFKAWLLGMTSGVQLSVFDEALHEQAMAKFRAWDPKTPSITLDMRSPVKDEPEWFDHELASTKRKPRSKKTKKADAEMAQSTDVDSQTAAADNVDTASRDLAISFRYKSPENLGYCVIVFDVTSKTRNDRYAIAVKAPSFLLNNFIGMYKKGLHNKAMRLIGEEHKSKTSSPGNAALSHLLEFTRMSLLRPQAVCVTQPQSLGVVDTSIRPGQVFNIKNISKNMDEAEFITISVNGTDVERNANNFIIFGK